MRYAFFFFSKSKYSNFKSPVKNPGRQACSEGFNSGVKGVITSSAKLTYIGALHVHVTSMACACIA